MKPTLWSAFLCMIKIPYTSIRSLSCRYSLLLNLLSPIQLNADPEGEGLICIGADLSPSTLFEAYSHGLFPWFSEGDPICWWRPEPRCIIRPQDYHPSKSLLRSMKKMDYKITINHAFETVIRSCSLPRSYANETWISEDIIQGYSALCLKQAMAYSIEVWENETGCRWPIWGQYWSWLLWRVYV